jgi:hypothetical protein
MRRVTAVVVSVVLPMGGACAGGQRDEARSTTPPPTTVAVSELTVPDTTAPLGPRYDAGVVPFESGVVEGSHDCVPPGGDGVAIARDRLRNPIYLVYAGATELVGNDGRGHQKVGVARSTDLQSWTVPPG